MNSLIRISDLFEAVFNSSLFELKHLQHSLFLYEFSEPELTRIQNAFKLDPIKFDGISEETLSQVFISYFHNYGFFNEQFNNQKIGWRYPTLTFYYNDDLGFGYVYTVYHEVVPFESWHTGEMIYEKLNEGYDSDY
jgi:hypothetical protein